MRSNRSYDVCIMFAAFRSLVAASAAVFLSILLITPSASAGDLVAFSTPVAAGTIVVRTSERRLYLVLGEGRALRYVVGVGRARSQWAGTSFIDGKYVRPNWAPPASIKRERPGLPDVIASGSPANPMGVAAMTLAGGGIRHPWHQRAELHRGLRLPRLHPDVQPGHSRSFRSRPHWNSRRSDALNLRNANLEGSRDSR